MVFVNFIVVTGIFAAVSNGSGNSEYLTTKYTRYMNRLLSKHFVYSRVPPKVQFLYFLRSSVAP